MQVLEIHIERYKDRPYVEVYVDLGWESKTFKMDERVDYSDRNYIADALPAIGVWLRSI